ncbi:MAG: hypothetical protein JKY51_07690 [Opitutaceae bacterium]|nr:hypothetical protein [Opitutaceae bacterium]
MIKTIDQARRFILAEKICTIFKSNLKEIKSLWDTVDLPDRQAGEGGWGEKIGAIWYWKNALPELFPNEIFYGKIRGGAAVLMSMAYLRESHYQAYHKPVEECRELSREIFELVRLEPYETGVLRRECLERFGCTKNRFDGALKELQITLNIVRSNEPGLERDTWLRFSDVYPDIQREGSSN